VTITGITGFLGAHVCSLFLKDGSYKVRGTVRDPNNEKKIGPVKAAFGADLFGQLELAKADLLNAESIREAIRGSQYVVHTASPFPAKNPKDENELIKPAVEGTMAVMRAAKEFGVKRVVITSSIAAIYPQKPENSKEAYTEKDWADLTVASAYEKSKAMAEKAAWDFVAALPENERFEVVTINPSMIMGPALIMGDFTSGIMAKKIMDAAFPGMPKIYMSVVDVRNVAEAHVRALKMPEAAGERFILTS